MVSYKLKFHKWQKKRCDVYNKQYIRVSDLPDMMGEKVNTLINYLSTKKLTKKLDGRPWNYISLDTAERVIPKKVPSWQKEDARIAFQEIRDLVAGSNNNNKKRELPETSWENYINLVSLSSSSSFEEEEQQQQRQVSPPKKRLQQDADAPASAATAVAAISDTVVTKPLVTSVAPLTTKEDVWWPDFVLGIQAALSRDKVELTDAMPLHVRAFFQRGEAAFAKL